MPAQKFFSRREFVKLVGIGTAGALLTNEFVSS